MNVLFKLALDRIESIFPSLRASLSTFVSDYSASALIELAVTFWQFFAVTFLAVFLAVTFLSSTEKFL